MKKFLALSLLLALSACGGSDTATTPANPTPPTGNAPQNSPPTVSIAAVAEHEEGTEVTLNGTAADSDGTITSYTWTQIGGTSASLDATNQTRLIFTAPQVNGRETLTFELKVTDNGGANATARVEVVVVDEVITTVSRAIEKLVEEGGLPVLDRTDELTGVDANTNGVRDDIEAYIASLQVSPDQTEKLLDFAGYMQLVVTVDPKSRTNPTAFDDEMGQSLICALYAFDDRATVRTYIRQIKSYTANTYDRAKRYDEYNSLLDGATLSMPSPANCQ